MNRRAVICSVLAVLIAGTAWTADKKTVPATRTKAAPAKPVPASNVRSVDPLGLPADQELITAKIPQSGAIGGKPAAPNDTAMNTQRSRTTLVFRVQIYTTQGFGDARKAEQVAQEIFDQPVHIDYEVPNFKVRVGDFPLREDADSYRQLAKAMGYTNTWVVPVTVGIAMAAPLYDSVSLPPKDSSTVVDTSASNAGPR